MFVGVIPAQNDRSVNSSTYTDTDPKNTCESFREKQVHATNTSITAYTISETTLQNMSWQARAPEKIYVRPYVTSSAPNDRSGNEKEKSRSEQNSRKHNLRKDGYGRETCIIGSEIVGCRQSAAATSCSLPSSASYKFLGNSTVVLIACNLAAI